MCEGTNSSRTALAAMRSAGLLPTSDDDGPADDGGSQARGHLRVPQGQGHERQDRVVLGPRALGFFIPVAMLGQFVREKQL